jgi:hypothetical protein
MRFGIEGYHTILISDLMNWAALLSKLAVCVSSGVKSNMHFVPFGRGWGLNHCCLPANCYLSVLSVLLARLSRVSWLKCPGRHAAVVPL